MQGSPPFRSATLDKTALSRVNTGRKEIFPQVFAFIQCREILGFHISALLAPYHLSPLAQTVNVSSIILDLIGPQIRTLPNVGSITEQGLLYSIEGSF